MTCRSVSRWRVVMAALAVGMLAACSQIRPEPISAAAGRELFHQRDLGSPYSTGIPYALWLAAMERYPGPLGRDWDDFADRFGVVPHDGNPPGLPTGFVLHRDWLSGTDFLMTTCALCHHGTIGGQTIEGIGNRNLRLNAMNNAVMGVVAREDFTEETMVPAAEAIAHTRGIPWDWRSTLAAKRAVRQLKVLAARNVELDSLDAGPGRNTPVEFTKAACNVPIEPPIGFVKFAAVWTYSKRRSFGWEGPFEGDLALAVSAVEFNKGMPPEDILAHRERWEALYEYLKQLRPPRYPGSVDAVRAERGHALFLGVCSGCHGTYGPAEPAEYVEHIIPLAVVGTDPDRLRSITPQLVAARNRGELGKLVHLVPRDGYVAVPLDGIWSRAPYLHNGAVPTLADLLRPARDRPVVFYVGADTGYDLDRLGLAYEEDRLPDGTRAGRRASPKQYEFDTRAPGNRNGGHEFGTDLSAEDRQALLEYLKQL